MKIIAALLLLTLPASGQVIDVHMHSYTHEEYWGQGKSHGGVSSPKTVDQHLKETIEEMNKNKIAFAVLSGSIESLQKYTDADSRFIPAYLDRETLIPPAEFESYIKSGTIKVFGEISAQYYGRTLTDSIYAPYLRLCERYGIPVFYHTGTAAPMSPYHGYPKFRISLGDPLLIEDILVKYPKLKIYLGHAGIGFYEHTIDMLVMYTHLYVDLGVILWADPYLNECAIRFLQFAKKAKVLDRIMFGSDQMVWPGAISKSIEFLNGLSFLTDEERRMILYGNAETFFKLK
ncbi:MAG: amidohydrolase family protein [Cyclobacteriaceae bacterium]|nr:amidohydrolase family protein [Cyclobacteriaceae bacterium]